MTMYSPRVNAHSADDRHRQSTFTASMSAPLAVAIRLSGHRQNATDLRHTLTSREAIAQAVGIIMARNDATPDAVLALLREASRDSIRGLAELAADTVETVAGQRPDVSSSHGPTVAD